MAKNILKQEVNIKSILTIVGVLVLFVVYIYIFLFPKYVEYKSVKAELNSAESELMVYQEKLTKMPSLEEKLENTKLELKSKNSKFEHNMNDGMFLIGFDKYRRSIGIDLIDYSVGDIIDYENISAIPINMNLKGNYKYIRELINYLEVQKNMTQVLDYNIETYVEELKQDTNNGDVTVKPKATGQVTANLKFIMYTDKDPNLELDIDDSSKWTPGKYNPFVPTT